MELFYADPESIRDDMAILDEFERRHIVQTLRKKQGETIHLTDGRGGQYIGTISQTAPRLAIQITQKKQMPPPACPVTLACGFIKQNRLDFVLEKGTELGVFHFVFFKSRYSNYFSANMQRFQKIIRQALKQSHHFYFPKISLFESFNDFLKFSEPFKMKFVAIDRTYPLLSEAFLNNKRTGPLLIAIGPEGGFSAEEVTNLFNDQFLGVSLGKNRLRTETAAISAISVINQFIQ